jgi:aspartyl-tRNA(Asn)/glutamyl-tRNA(Gln) amidotransferase subunit C
MAKLSRDEILKIAKLAKLSLTDDEVLKYQNQLSSVLDYVSQISEIDTKNLEEYRQNENQNRSAKDKPKKCDNRDKLLNNAPKKKDGFFTVPPVFK